MSFATSCPSCSTTFRVVRDQLKVSEGWVRCGRCGEVFCALDGLFELDRDDVLPASPPARQETGAPQAPDSPPTQAIASAEPVALEPVRPDEAPPSALPERPASAPEIEAPAQALAETVPVPVPESEPEPEPESELQLAAAASAWPVERAAAAPEAGAALDASDPIVSAEGTTPLLQESADEEFDEAPLAAPSSRFAGSTGRPTVEPELRREDTSLLRPSRLPAMPVEEEEAATSADVLDSRFFEDEDDEAAWPDDRRETPGSEDFADARFSSTLGHSDFAPERDAAETPAPAAGTASAPMPLESEAAAPGFLQQARRQERLRQPAVRATMAGLAAGLALLLGLQVVVQQRDALAAAQPALRPWLERWCSWTGCELGPLRRIEDVVLDHSALADAGAGRPGYRLSLLLRNRGDATLALPAIELTLTDTGGQLVARRVLLPSDFQSAPTLIAPRAQLALNIGIDTPGRRLAGYTVETFYP